MISVGRDSALRLRLRLRYQPPPPSLSTHLRCRSPGVYCCLHQSPRKLDQRVVLRHRELDRRERTPGEFEMISTGPTQCVRLCVDRWVLDSQSSALEQRAGKMTGRAHEEQTRLCRRREEERGRSSGRNQACSRGEALLSRRRQHDPRLSCSRSLLLAHAAQVSLCIIHSRTKKL